MFIIVLTPSRFNCHLLCFWVQPWTSCSHMCSMPLNLRPCGTIEISII